MYLNCETVSSFTSLRKEEVAALSGPNEFAEFYGRLRSLKDYHRKFPNEVLSYHVLIILYQPHSLITVILYYSTCNFILWTSCFS